MSKHKTDGKKKKKGSQLVIRLAKDERDAFVTLCDRLDTSAAREIRRFMRDWVAAHSDKTEASAETATAQTPEAEPAAASLGDGAEGGGADKPGEPAATPKPRSKSAAT